MSFENLQTALDAGAAAVTPKEIDLAGPVVSFVVPDGYRIDTPDLEKFAAAPKRKRGTVQPADLDSLIAYTNAHKAAGTAVYVDPHALRITSVINDHLPEANHADAGFGDHQAVLALQHTPEWLAWVAADGNMTSQLEFAEFLEDNAKDIKTPDPATLLEIASTFNSKTDASYKSAVRLQSGALSVAYTEDITATAGASGQLEIPGTFEIALAVFEGGPKYGVTARLRHRCHGGTLRLGFKLERLTDVLRYAVAGDTENGILPRVRKEIEGVQTYVGAPRS